MADMCQWDVMLVIRELPGVKTVMSKDRMQDGTIVVDRIPVPGRCDGGPIALDVKFTNGFGASVIRNGGSYGGAEGLLEVASVGLDGKLEYEHPAMGGDVRGWLNVEEMVELLKQLAEPGRGK